MISVAHVATNHIMITTWNATCDHEGVKGLGCYQEHPNLRDLYYHQGNGFINARAVAEGNFLRLWPYNSQGLS